MSLSMWHAIQWSFMAGFVTALIGLVVYALISPPYGLGLIGSGILAIGISALLDTVNGWLLERHRRRVQRSL